MTYPESIIKYCRKLYLTITPDGNQIYKWKEIREKGEKKLKSDSKDGKSDSKITDAQLNRWVKKYKWAEDLQEVKDRYAQAIRDKAEAERGELLDKAATTIELGRKKNERAFNNLHDVIEAKIFFTNEYYRKLCGEKVESSDADIEKGRLTEAQEIALYRSLALRQTDYDKMVADATIEDNDLHITYEVIKTPEVTEEKDGSTPDTDHGKR